MKKFFKIIIILLVILIVAIIILGLWLSHVPSSTYQVEDIDADEHWGNITGSLSYPSDFIPAMGVCAETINKENYYCTYEMLASDDYLYGYGYSLEVPPGSYYVYAHLVDEENENIGFTDEEKAYYSKFVSCGGSIECTSHIPIKVEVDRYESVTRIDPIDWYNY